MVLWWLILSLVSHGEGQYDCEWHSPVHCPNCPEKCMRDTDGILNDGPRDKIITDLQYMEEYLGIAKHDQLYSANYSMAKTFHLITPPDLRSFEIYASENEITESPNVSNLKVTASLPQETLKNWPYVITFFTVFLPNMTFFNISEVLFENRLIGLKVANNQFSGLQQRVNITIHNFTNINEAADPQCVFLNYSTQKFSTDGCDTQWERNGTNITCSCNHLTVFGVLLVNIQSEKDDQSSKLTTYLSAKDQKIVKYISVVGCSLSLVPQIATLLIFSTNKQIRADDSKKMHISLAIALILLNAHLLPTEMVAEMPSPELCIYVAISIHYSLLATLSWMALEGFHLYLLIVKVFNIYINRYMLKVSLVGWGIPAIIVSVVLIINNEAYGPVALDLSQPNGTKICYITDDTVKIVSALVVFCLMFIFNMAMFVVTVRWVLCGLSSKKFMQGDRDAAKRNLCTVLSITVFLGVTWGMIFFSFGQLGTVGHYLFATLNTLQGVFIFLYFAMSLKKIKESEAKRSATQGTSS